MFIDRWEGFKRLAISIKQKEEKTALTTMIYFLDAFHSVFFDKHFNNLKKIDTITNCA